MIVFTVDTIGAASSCEEETEIGTAFLIEEIGGSVADIELGIASS